MPGIIKKLLLPVLLLLSYEAVFAQPTQEEKKLLFNKIDTLLTNYINYSRFLESAKSNITPGAINNFRQLFVSDKVTLPDEMSPAYFDKSKEKPRLPSFNSIETEVDKLKDKVPVLSAKSTNSISKLGSISDSINFYLKGLNEDRNTFFQTYDEINKKMAAYNAELLNKEKIVNRSLSDFIIMVEANYPEGFSVKLLNSVVSFKDISNNEVKLLIEKRIYGKLYGSGVKLQNQDTLMLTLKVSENYSKLQIANIEMVGYRLDFLNDNDHDFIANPIDACPDDKGLFQLTGCPPAGEKNFTANMAGYLNTRNTDSTTAVTARSEVDAKTKEIAGRISGLERLINAPPHWILSFGASAGILTSTLTSAGSGYSSNISSREINPASTFSGGKSFGGDVMAEHYFGTQSNFGIGFGLAFNSMSGTIKKDAFHVEYKAVDEANGDRKGGNFFTQIITATKGIEEKVTISNFAVPAMAIYKGNVTKALGYKIEAGVALNLFYKSNMSNTNGTFDYEAVYRYTSPFPATGGQDYFDPRVSQTATGFDPTSWLITKDRATQLNVDAINYFSLMQGNNYPVGLNVAPKSTNKTASFSTGISFIIRPSITLNFSKGSSFNIGVYYSKTSFSQSGNYRMIDENKTYNTLMQGVSKSSNSNFGIHVSYSYSLFYYLSKWTKELSGLR